MPKIIYHLTKRCPRWGTEGPPRQKGTSMHARQAEVRPLPVRTTKLNNHAKNMEKRLNSPRWGFVRASWTSQHRSKRFWLSNLGRWEAAQRVAWTQSLVGRLKENVYLVFSNTQVIASPSYAPVSDRQRRSFMMKGSQPSAPLIQHGRCYSRWNKINKKSQNK